MTDKNISPPQPFPYPECWFMRKLLKTPLLLYRLGLGKLIGKYILILSSTGRKSDKTRRTPVEYFKHGSLIYIISGFGEQTDWYQNVMANPQVTVQTDQGTMTDIARSPTTDEEWMAVYAYLSQQPHSKVVHA